MRSRITSTAKAMIDFGLPAVTILNAYENNEGIQKTRALPASQTKDDIKNQFSLNSSLSNMIIFGICALDFALEMYRSEAWKHMNTGQRIGVVLLAMFGAFGAIYAATRINVEHNTFAAGLTVGIGMLLVNLAKNGATFFEARAQEIAPQAQSKEETTRLTLRHSAEEV